MMHFISTQEKRSVLRQTFFDVALEFKSSPEQIVARWTNSRSSPPCCHLNYVSSFSSGLFTSSQFTLCFYYDLPSSIHSSFFRIDTSAPLNASGFGLSRTVHHMYPFAGRYLYPGSSYFDHYNPLATAD